MDINYILGTLNTLLIERTTDIEQGGISYIDTYKEDKENLENAILLLKELQQKKEEEKSIFATIRWSLEDLEEVFKKQSIPWTEENRQIFLQGRGGRTLEEQSVSTGWEILADMMENFEFVGQVEQIIEWCPHCETEVKLENKFEKQQCPECEEEILPCSMCEDPRKCEQCPIE